MNGTSPENFRRPANSRGTAATELALSLPLLMLLALAASDFGRVFHAREIVSNAARTGASAGACRGFTPITRQAWEDHVLESATEEMQSLASFNEADMIYELEVTGEATDFPRTAVTINYLFRSFVAWPGLPTEIEIRERVEVQRFR
ncbi:MAG: pilus assembly protein [Pirellulales bacterium]|nr:pilus assembly protein [Pirellulales bacterium]